jgi:acetyl-CoA carboxylase biotin carboxylase subunit
MLKKVLVANRGEIALRVMRTLEEMGVASVAVASDIDCNAPHAIHANEVVEIGPAPAPESYLRIDKLIDAAKQTGCDSVHPGYGFLSENAEFAEACGAAGLVFIGPSPGAMRIMGSKIESRRAMEKAGIPVVPGFQEDDADDDAMLAAAKKLGWPLVVKASAGGGGKGMRVVNAAKELSVALRVARSEALSAFGSDAVYLERFLSHPRHVEIQVFGDASGNIFHLGERECSIQRRHQKIIEETPSPAVSPALRARMGEAAVEAARAVDYRNAGTVEFLLDENGDFFFLEMNTRLQVEHPVTEMVYGVDMVAAQVLTAAGEPLPFEPERLEPRGHAVEVRIYAEDPAQGFIPQIGPVLRLRHPERPGVRVDSGLAEGREVTTHYDPLLAKVSAWGENRDIATRRLRAALHEMAVLGVNTNIDFLSDVLALPAWDAGELHTGFLEQHIPSWKVAAHLPDEALALAAEASVSATSVASGGDGGDIPTPWSTLGRWTPLEKG